MMFAPPGYPYVQHPGFKFGLGLDGYGSGLPHTNPFELWEPFNHMPPQHQYQQPQYGPGMFDEQQSQQAFDRNRKHSKDEGQVWRHSKISSPSKKNIIPSPAAAATKKKKTESQFSVEQATELPNWVNKFMTEQAEEDQVAVSSPDADQAEKPSNVDPQSPECRDEKHVFKIPFPVITKKRKPKPQKGSSSVQAFSSELVDVQQQFPHEESPAKPDDKNMINSYVCEPMNPALINPSDFLAFEYAGGSRSHYLHEQYKYIREMYDLLGADAFDCNAFTNKKASAMVGESVVGCDGDNWKPPEKPYDLPASIKYVIKSISIQYFIYLMFLYIPVLYRQRLPRMKMEVYEVDVLFYIFFTYTGDILQMFAAGEL
jgi:hypothetical protein